MQGKQNKPGRPGDAAAGQPPLNAPMSVTLGQNKGGGDVVMEGDNTEGSKGSSKNAARPAGGSPVNMSQVVELLEVNGEVPQARFGHTITTVSKSKIVLFGGATGDTGKYSMTGETFMYNILNKAWQKLQGKAAHQIFRFKSNL